MNISTYGTAFTSYDVKANKLTKEQITNEKVSADETVIQILRVLQQVIFMQEPLGDTK